MNLTRQAAKCSSSRAVWGRPCQSHVATLPHRGQLTRVNTRSGGLGDDDVDVAVFRFTLGIPGFDDRLIPRFVGLAGGALLGINHVLGASTAAQDRTELLGLMLAATLVVAPWIEERLLEIQPGRGRKELGAVEGATNAFLLSPSLGDDRKKELAWASFTLLKNANCCSVLIAGKGSQLLLARGVVSSSVDTKDAKAALAQASQDLASSSGRAAPLASVLSGATQQLYLNDRPALQQSGLASCACIPVGAQNAVVQHIPGVPGAALVVLSERAGGLSEKDRSWVAAVASKLAPVAS